MQGMCKMTRGPSERSPGGVFWLDKESNEYITFDPMKKKANQQFDVTDASGGLDLIEFSGGLDLIWQSFSGSLHLARLDLCPPLGGCFIMSRECRQLLVDLQDENMLCRLTSSRTAEQSEQ